MPLFAAFLRGMNVGGHRLTNEQLRAHFEAIGFEAVRTFRASGNVVFSAGALAEEVVAGRIEAGLERALGYAVPTYIRSASEMLELAASRPFPERLVRASSGKLQVALLTDRPSASARRRVQALSGDDDLLAFGARELFWLPSAGVLDSPLDMKAIARLLGPMTMRTKNTSSSSPSATSRPSPVRLLTDGERCFAETTPRRDPDGHRRDSPGSSRRRGVGSRARARARPLPRRGRRGRVAGAL